MKVDAGIVMACRSCERPDARFKVVSEHSTASGVTRYVRCTCGALQVQHRSRYDNTEWQTLGGQRAHAAA